VQSLAIGRRPRARVPAPATIFGQHSSQNQLEFRRHSAHQRRQRWEPHGPSAPANSSFESRTSSNGPTPAIISNKIQRARVDIGAGRPRFAARLLGGHVARGADRQAAGG
jgi:hypothetical protein